MSYRILHYNWAPYYQKRLQGGGVSIYCRNLIDYLSEKPEYQVNFMYSGFDYTYLNSEPHLRKVVNTRHPEVSTFSIVNSPIIAPSHISFNDPMGSVRNAQVEKLFSQFLSKQKPYNIIHFHNLEGLTANCLKIAKERGAKVVFNLHNYWSVCPQVNLWQQESRPCRDYLDGRACVSCLTDIIELDLELTKRRIIDLGNLLGLDEKSLILRLTYEVIYKKIWRKIRRNKLTGIATSPLKKPLDVTGTDLPQMASLYRQRREEIVDFINQYVDVALAVSDRTRSIYKQYGVAPARLRTQYIGSKATQFPIPANNPASYSKEQPFRLIYMGPARKDKGFYYLIEQLRCLSQEELKSTNLVIASRVDDYTELNMAIEQRGRILSLAQSLYQLRYYPGYAYENIPNILDGIHLGVVPPLWEDNLPQVVYELLACRVPVLCSNRGGAQEYVRHPAFIFNPDKEGDFQYKLRTIRENPHLLEEFWKEARQVKSLEQDFKELLEIYQACTTLVTC